MPDSPTLCVLRFAARYGSIADFYGVGGPLRVAVYGFLVRIGADSTRRAEAIRALTEELGRLPTPCDVLNIVEGDLPIPSEVTKAIYDTLSAE